MGSKNKMQDSKNILIGTLLLIITILLVVIMISLFMMSQDSNTQSDIESPADTSENIAPRRDISSELEDLQENYDNCIAEGDAAYTDSLNKIPSNIDSATRWSYIESVRQTVDSHKQNCDRMYQTKKDNITAER